MSLPHDIQDFLAGYPESTNDSSQTANLAFYSNRLRCRPDNLLVQEIHDRWFGDYDTLERKHGFIQWLFPIQEHGMNYESQPLQPHEIDAMKADPAIVERVLASYRLMLDFYGMQLVDADTGLLRRSSPPRDYAARFRNLVRSTHNNLRISRILKCLSELGLERLNAGFLLHVLHEQSACGELGSRALVASMDRWWANCVRNEEEREWIAGVVAKARQDTRFVFSREMYEGALARRRSTGSLRGAEATVSLAASADQS